MSDKGPFFWLKQFGGLGDGNDSRQYEYNVLQSLNRYLSPGPRMQEVLRQDPPTLAGFNEVFPAFPFLLGCSQLKGLQVAKNRKTPPAYAVHKDPDSTEPARFRKFHKVPFVIAYAELVAALPAGDPRPACLIFPRKGVRGGMCIYQDDQLQFWDDGLVWGYRYVENEQEHCLFVRPLPAWLRSVGARIDFKSRF